MTVKVTLASYPIFSVERREHEAIWDLHVQIPIHEVKSQEYMERVVGAIGLRIGEALAEFNPEIPKKGAHLN